MTSVRKSLSAVPPPLPVVQGHCVECGYDIVGMADEAVCPECGYSVFSSRNGARIVLSTPAYRATVKRGITFVVIANALMALVFGVWAPAMSFHLLPEWMQDGWIVAAVMLSPHVLSLAGYWMYAAPNRGLQKIEKWMSWRRFVRVSIVAQVGLVLGMMAVTIIDNNTGFISKARSLNWLIQFAGTAAFVCIPGFWFFRLIASIKYARQLAKAMRDDGFDCDTGELGSIEMTLVYLAFAILTAFLFLFVLFEVKYVWMLWKIRRGLVSIPEGRMGLDLKT